MRNPLSKAIRRADTLYASLSGSRYASKRVHRFGLLVDSVSSEEFRNYVKLLGKAIAIIPSQRLDKEERDYLLDVPKNIWYQMEKINSARFGSEQFKKGLACVILSLDSAQRAQKQV